MSGPIQEPRRSWLARLLIALGLAEPAPEEGFDREETGSRQPVCHVCGAVVPRDGQARHREWHRTNDAGT